MAFNVKPPYMPSTILWHSLSFKECLFYCIPEYRSFIAQKISICYDIMWQLLLSRNPKEMYPVGLFCCKKPRNIKYNIFSTHHLTFGTGLPSNLVFMSNMSPSSTSMALSISRPNEGGIWAMFKFALVSAWPTKLDAVTLYCWNQKNYNNTNHNHTDRLKGCS